MPLASQFAERLNITFRDLTILEQAFIHRSYLNEHREIKLAHNERLEFLGDAVLELVVTDYLFAQYPDKDEGDLTSLRAALVNAVTLSEVASTLGMNDYLLLSKGESKDTGRARQVILANTFEAVVGAIYLDSGYEAARSFIAKHLFKKTEEIVSKNLWQDAKSFFQEKAQEKLSLTPAYKVIRESGPDHNKRFTIGLYLNEELVATGEGHSKQEAEQAAAAIGLEVKKWQGGVLQ
ncbi:MAG: ribonuclease III [Candidatus Pacebacteria bacterium]|nr:ribonuclease III [Candidatus Paceibacterota bacterium]